MAEKPGKVRVASTSGRQFKPAGNALVSFVIMIVGIWAIITALQWPFKAALFPVIVGVPLFMMALLEFFLSIFKKEHRDKQKNTQGFTAPEEPESRGSRSIFFWIVAFLGLIVLVGFPVAVPVFFILYFKLRGRNRWTSTLGLTAVACGFFYGLFIRLLHVPFPEGWVQRWLGIPGAW